MVLRALGTKVKHVWYAVVMVLLLGLVRALIIPAMHL